MTYELAAFLAALRGALSGSVAVSTGFRFPVFFVLRKSESQAESADLQPWFVICSDIF